tara:strand:- start:194 stop:589 length:396 start_codon:yes stop_codon:yes gene_type:complete
VTSGHISVDDEVFPKRLGIIYAEVLELATSYEVQEMAIEDVFLAKNPNSALKLGQARGVAIAAGIAKDLEIFEYAARQVKKTIVGKGGASKAQIQHMVRVLLNLPGVPQSDAADGLAIALCHAHSTRRPEL